MSMFEKDRNTPEALSADDLDDGIYFKMPESEYHALPRLSASGIKNILTSLPTFWAKSWMNPDRETNDDTNAKILGRAYHAAIFEPDDFENRYTCPPDLDGIPNLLATDTEVKQALKEHGQTQAIAGEKALDRAIRLAEIDARPIKSLILDEYESNLNGRQPIGVQYWQQIKRDIERIEKNPEVYHLVTGGASEVTILWTCPETGIKMKSRIDKLKLDRFVDLKSFANKNGKPVNQAIADQVQYYQYYLSMRVYQQAISMIAQLSLNAMDIETIEMTKQDHEWLNLTATLREKTTPHEPWLLFQEKGGVPNLLARRLNLQIYPEGVEAQSIGAENHGIKSADGILCRKADLEIARAKHLFAQASAVYGTDGDPWFPFDMIGEIGDADFRDYFLEETPA